jgi:uncharacterized cupredoxin-like copper-binding protein
MRFTSRVPLVLCLSILTVACRGEDDTGATQLAAGQAEETANVVVVTTRDHEFDAPREIVPGWTTFRLVDNGPEPHHMVLARLEDGRTMDDFMAALQAGSLEGIGVAVGGPNAPGPGNEGNATVYLEPGEYVMACFIPSPDGVPHVAKGMVRPLTVRGEPAQAREPTADVEVTFVDYAFSMPEVQSGRRTIRVTTDGSASEAHEVLLARLAPGRTVQDLNDWIHSMEGPPPAEFLGGVTNLEQGRSAYFSADFTPGEYALICPIPSVHDGEAHSSKGMMRQFTVH